MLVTPGPVIEAITAWLAMPVMPPTESEFPTDKVVHFAMFAVCAFLSFRAWAVRQGTLVMLAALLVFAALTESLQMVIPGRSGDLMDFMADATGVLMGFWWYQHSAGKVQTDNNA
jgi:VanZ family protein